MPSNALNKSINFAPAAPVIEALGLNKMKLTARIDDDCQCMVSYFHKLLKLLKESQTEEARAPIEVHDSNSDISLVSYHGMSHLIKPDMVINIYSLVDYWLNEICDYHRQRMNLSLKAKDIKGDGELNASTQSFF